MAQVNSRTLVLKHADGADYIKAPKLAALLADGWQIVSFESRVIDATVMVKLRHSAATKSDAPPADGDIVWQGRPPFPGNLK